MDGRELGDMIREAAAGLELKGRDRLIAERLAREPELIKSKLAKASPQTLASLIEKLNETQRRELEKQLGKLGGGADGR